MLAEEVPVAHHLQGRSDGAGLKLKAAKPVSRHCI